MSKEELSSVMKIARKSKNLQKKVHFQRKQSIYEQRAEKLRKTAEDKEKKARNLSTLKEQLTVEIARIGLWADESDINDALSNMKTVKDKREALKLQLDLRFSMQNVTDPFFFYPLRE